MERETIEIDKEWIDLLRQYKLSNFKNISDISKTCDDDDSNTHEFIVQRISDGKFFAGTYELWPGANEVDDSVDDIEEVFPVEKTIIVYE